MNPHQRCLQAKVKYRNEPKTGDLLVLNDNKTDVVHFTSRHKKSIEHIKSLKIHTAGVLLMFVLRFYGMICLCF